jgi:lysophospholipase L1-like esterase
VERHGIWHHWLYHSRFSDTDPAVALANMSTAWQQAHQQLHTADVLLVTLGTSRVYRLSETGTVVANCHQWPASTFRQEWLSAEHITSVWIELLQQLRALRPNLQVLFSVSPIRHLADGLVHNQLSKSTLLVAVHECCNQLTGVHYFPAYEAFMDDLRDYRFYAPDMVHPSEQGVEYVWQLFTTAWVQPDPLHHTMQQLHRFLNHRPRFPTSETYQRLLQQQYELIIQLEKQHPLLDFSDELQQLRQLREQYQP